MRNIGVEKIKMYESAIKGDITGYKDPERPDLNLEWLTGRLERHYHAFYDMHKSDIAA